MAIPTNYYHADRASVANQRTGYSADGYWAPKSWFDSIEEPDPAATGGLAKTVATDHTFLTGKGFLKVYVLPDSISGDGESTGNEGAKHLIWKPKFILPGDTAAQQNMLEEHLLNEEAVLLVKDINCPAGGYRQFGCDCNGAIVNDMKFTSGTKNGGEKGWALEMSSACRYFYTGDITEAV